MSLALGVTLEVIDAMPEASFHRWQVYAAGKMLPNRRLEVMLARLTAEVSAGRGVKDISPADFEIKMAPDESAPVITRPADFNPRGKRKKRAS